MHLQVLAWRQPPLWWPGWDSCSRLFPKNTPSRWHPLWLRWVMDPWKPHGWVESGEQPSSCNCGKVEQDGWRAQTWTRQFGADGGRCWSKICYCSPHPPQAQTYSRLLPTSLGTSWACSTPVSRGPSCLRTTPSRTRWGWARMTSKASSTCMELTPEFCLHHHPHLRPRQTQRPMRLSPMWAGHHFNQWWLNE